MVLVDTSVLIDYFKGLDNKPAGKFQTILESQVPFGINSFIYHELLQGARSEEEFKKLKKYLDTQRFYSLKDEKESFAEAAKIYFKCRKKGVTISSTIDCIIAQTALENRLLLLHNDSDFNKIAKIVNLKFF